MTGWRKSCRLESRQKTATEEKEDKGKHTLFSIARGESKDVAADEEGMRLRQAIFACMPFAATEQVDPDWSEMVMNMELALYQFQGRFVARARSS